MQSARSIDGLFLFSCVRLVARFGRKGVDPEMVPGYLDVVKHPIGKGSLSVVVCLYDVEMKAFHLVGHPLARRWITFLLVGLVLRAFFA